MAQQAQDRRRRGGTANMQTGARRPGLNAGLTPHQLVAGASLNPTEPWSPHLEMGLIGFCENKWLCKVHRTIPYLYVLPLLLLILVVILDVLLKI